MSSKRPPNILLVTGIITTPTESCSLGSLNSYQSEQRDKLNWAAEIANLDTNVSIPKNPDGTAIPVNIEWSKNIVGEESPFIKLVGTGEKGTWMGKPHHRFNKKDKIKYTCGVTDVPVMSCSNCHQIYYAALTCKQKQCPDCYKGWIQRAKDKIIPRLLSKTALDESRKANIERSTADYRDIWDVRLVHIVVSKRDLYKDWKPETKAEMDMERRDAINYITAKGAVGGVALPHPFRAKDEAKKLSYNDGKHIWDWIRDQPSPWGYYFTSYHLHFFAYIGKLESPVPGEKFMYKVIEDTDGKVVNFLRKSKRTKDLSRELTYLLGHTGYLANDPRSMESYVYFGTCSKRTLTKALKDALDEEIKTAKDAEPKRVPKPCKLCGGKLEPFDRGAIRMLFYDDIDDDGGGPGISYLEADDEIGSYHLINNTAKSKAKWLEDLRAIYNGEIPADSKLFHVEYEGGAEDEAEN